MKRHGVLAAGTAALLLFQFLHAPVLAQGSPDIVWMAGSQWWPQDAHFFPDGKSFATIGEDTTVKIWRTSDGMLIRTIMDLEYQRDAAVSPDGTMIASASVINTRVYRAADGAVLKTVDGQWAVAFSADGQTIATGTWGDPIAGDVVKLWRLSDGALLRSLTAHSSSHPRSLVFSRDGKTVAARYEGQNAIRVWNVADGKLLFSLTDHTLPVNAIAYSHDGTMIASASSDSTGTIRLRRASDGAVVRKVDIAGGASAVVFSPDDQSLAVAAATPRLIRVSDGALVRDFAGQPDQTSGLDISPDGQTLVTASRNIGIRLWDVSDGTLLKTIEGRTDGSVLTVSPDGKYLASGGLDMTCRLWRMSDGEPLRTLVTQPSPYGGDTAVAFSPNSQTIAVGRGTGFYPFYLSLLHVPDGALLKDLGRSDFSPVAYAAFSPDGQIVASGGYGDRHIYLWRVADATLVRTITAHPGPVSSVAFAPDGKTVVSAGAGDSNGQVRVWRVADGALMRTFNGFFGGRQSISISPDGLLLAVPDLSGVNVWRVSDGALIQTLPMPRPLLAAFSPDGSTLATSDAFDWTIRLFRTDDWSSIAYDQETGGWPDMEAATGITFSTDSQVFVYSRTEGTIVAARNPLAYKRTPAVVQSLKVERNPVGGGSEIIGTVTLAEPAPKGGFVDLSSSDTAVAIVPPSLRFNPGDTSVQFPVTTFRVASSKSVTLMTSGADTKTLTLRVVPARLWQLTFSSNPAWGGNQVTGTAILTGKPPAGGMEMSLESTRPDIVGLPSSVTVPEDSDRVAFPITTASVTQKTDVIIRATGGDVELKITLRLWPSAIVDLSFNPNPVWSGNVTTGVLALGGTAPAGGATYTLSADKPDVIQLPESVTIPEGSSRVEFPVTTPILSQKTEVIVTATGRGETWKITLRIWPYRLIRMEFSGNPVKAGAPVTGTLEIGGVAPSGGVTYALTSADPAVVTVPATVTIPAGQRSVTFPITSTAVSEAMEVVITVAGNGEVWKATLRLVP